MEDHLAESVRAALAQLPDLPEGFDAGAVGVEFQTPNDPSHGDLATNVALQLARPLKRAPRQIAEGIVAHWAPDPSRVEAVEVAGPGFINVRFASAHLADGLAQILEAGAGWGRTDDHTRETALVEYVSANPTGPLTVGHGRNAVLGDTLANLLAWTGYDVTREYYFNDAGRQMRVLGESVRARYTAIVRPDTPTKEIEGGLTRPRVVPRGRVPRRVHHRHRPAPRRRARRRPPRRPRRGAVHGRRARRHLRGDRGYARPARRFARTASSTSATLYESGAVWDVVDRLKAAGLAYERDGATWFKTSELGKTETTREGGEEGKDVVLVKSSGEPTYRLPDIAYHLDKLDRGFDLALDVFGADHIATYPDVLRGLEALGADASRVDVVVYQFVTLVRGGEPVKMSTRKANYVTLDELMDEVGGGRGPVLLPHALALTRTSTSTSTWPRRRRTKTPCSTSSTLTPGSRRSSGRRRRPGSWRGAGRTWVSSRTSRRRRS